MPGDTQGRQEQTDKRKNLVAHRGSWAPPGVPAIGTPPANHLTRKEKTKKRKGPKPPQGSTRNANTTPHQTEKRGEEASG